MKQPSLKSLLSKHGLPRSPSHGEMAPCFAKRSLLEIIRKPKPKRFGFVLLPIVRCILTSDGAAGIRSPASNSWLTWDDCVPGLGYTVPANWQDAEDPMKPLVKFKSLLHEMTQTTPTCLWNDSASLQELTYSLENGAVGATCNPVIVGEVLKKEMHLWKGRIQELIEELPLATEDQIAWRVVEEISIKAAELLMPVFEQQHGSNGRLSIQTDPRFYRDRKAIMAQALHFNALAPNMIVKIPVTKAGIAAIEEATYQGISINATVSFTLPQCIAVAEAVERGLKRRQGEGKEIAGMGPVCTIMVGRLDDWLKVVAEKDHITKDPGYFEWDGVAVFKKTYEIFRQRGYRIRLLSAAFRNHMHWSE